MSDYYIGKIAKAANLNIETIRYYERNGLIPAPERTEGGYRVYEPSVLERLEFIRHAKSAGFTLAEIRHLLSMLDSKNADVDYVSGLLDKKTEEIGRKMSEYASRLEFLQKIKGNLYHPQKCPVLQPLMKDIQAAKTQKRD